MSVAGLVQAGPRPFARRTMPDEVTSGCNDRRGRERRHPCRSGAEPAVVSRQPRWSSPSPAAGAGPVAGGCPVRPAELALAVPSTVRVDTAHSAVRSAGGRAVFVSPLSAAAAETGAGASWHLARGGRHAGLPSAAQIFMVFFGARSAGPGRTTSARRRASLSSPPPGSLTSADQPGERPDPRPCQLPVGFLTLTGRLSPNRRDPELRTRT